MTQKPDGYAKFFQEARRARVDSEPVRGVVPKTTANSGRAAKPETPEERLKRELSRRINERRAQRRDSPKHRRGPNGSRARFPTAAAGFTLVAVACAAAAWVWPDLASSAWSRAALEFSRYELGVFTAAGAAGPEKPSTTKSKTGDATAPKAEKVAANGRADGANASQAEGPSAADENSAPKVLTPEEVSVFSKLSDRKKQLDLRETELNKVEEELQKQKAELEKKIQQLESTRRDIASALKTKVATDQDKVEKLVQVYSNMKPQQAAKVIESLNEDLAVEVLDKMKKKSAADMLNVMDPKKAQKLSEVLAGYKRAD